MANQAYLTVDVTLSESVSEYASVLDFHNEGLNFVEKTQSLEQPQEQQQNEDNEDEEDLISYKDELYQEIADSAKYLVAVPDKEFESVANLANYILTFSENYNNLLIEFLTTLVKAFEFDDVSKKVVKNKKKSLKLNSVISVLSNSFNLTDIISQQTKLTIFDLILDLVSVLDNASILLPYVDQVESAFVESSSSDVEQARSVIIKFAKLIKSTDELKSLELYKLAVFKLSSPSQTIVEDFLVEILNSQQVIDLTFISSQTTVEIPSSYASLIKEYLSLSAPEFQSKISSYSNLKSLDLNQISKKNQYLTLAKLALNEKKISYAELASKLNIKQEQVEIFVFDAIKNKVIEAKLSQVEESLHVYKVLLVVKEIELQDWLDVKTILLDWRAKLKEVKGLVEQAQRKKAKA